MHSTNIINENHKENINKKTKISQNNAILKVNEL